MSRIRDLLGDARRRLRDAALAPPPREAHLLLGHVLDLSEAQLLARDDRPVEPEEEARFTALLERRLLGEPVAYLTGAREFYGRPFLVDSRTLIPRPETEHLVEAVLRLELPATPRIVDLGTGSGCIAVTLALELRRALVVAIDSSLGALAVARRNAAALGASDRVLLQQGNWAAALDSSKVDVVVTNPPYISRREGVRISPEITDFEPHVALFSERDPLNEVDDGLTSYRRIFSALAGLRPGTPVLGEIGQGQEARVAALAEDLGFAPARTIDDHAGVARVVVVNRR